jgi:hypothetical protein
MLVGLAQVVSMSESIYERIASRQVSLALVIGIVVFVGLIVLTVAFQWSHFLGFDLTQSFTDLWFWILFSGSGVSLTLINYGLYRPKKAQPSSPSQEPTSLPQSPETPDMVLDPQIIAVLIRLARMDWRRTLRDQVKYVWQDVEKESWHPRFRIWKDIDPVLKKLLVPDKSEYDALEHFANACDQFSDNPNKADSDALKTLCKNRFDRLKELGLVY